MQALKASETVQLWLKSQINVAAGLAADDVGGHDG